MSTKKNKALYRYFIDEVVNKGNLAVLDEYGAIDMVDHNQPGPDIAPGLEGVKQVFTMFRTAFPNLNFTVEDQIAEGDKVVSRVTVRGTHKGEFMGIAPTGKQVTVELIDIHHITGGKVVERWGIVDMLGMMQQLGVVPPPGQGGK